jgi:hypothetical protein
MLSGVCRLIANHRSSSSSEAHQKSGPFPPPALPGFIGHTTLSDSRRHRRLPRRRGRYPRAVRASPDYPHHPSNVPCPLPRRIGTGASVGCFPIPLWPSPLCRRVGIRDFTFEACSGFTRVTARWIAQPPKAAFVTRLRPARLPGRVARQLPGPTDNFLGGSFLHW